MNPFTDEYFLEEVKKFGPPAMKFDGLEIDIPTPVGRLDDYLTVNFRIGDMPMPRFLVDNKLWFSLTPMEVQSMWVPIELAHGRVATGGLGLGYFALKAATQLNVSKVTVFEREYRAIDAFTRWAKDRPEFAKIEFVQGDVRKKLTKKYDFIFMDIYADYWDDEIKQDIELFVVERKLVKPKYYRFWTQEAVILAAFLLGMRVPVSINERMFYSHFAEKQELRYISPIEYPQHNRAFIRSIINSLYAKPKTKAAPQRV